MSSTTVHGRMADVIGSDRVAPGTASDSVAGVPAPVVVRPQNTRQVAAVLACASATGASVVVRGAGTKLDWGGTPRRVDAVLDLSEMSAILEHEPGDLVVHTQAGVRLCDLNRVVADARQRLALDEVVPGSTLGGVIATALAGPRRMRYGTVRDLLIGVTAVRSDGTVTHSGGKVVKNVAGYDLCKLYTGSYGTLAVVTTAVFRLHPAPEATAFVVTQSNEPASAISTALHSQAALTALEVIQRAGRARIVALVEGREASVRARALGLAHDLGGDARVCAQPPEQFGRLPGPITLKLTCELSSVAPLLADVTRLERAHATPIVVSGSAGTGVLFAGTEADLPSAILDGLREACTRHGGSAVVLRAPDDVRSRLPLWGPVAGLDLMRRVKQQFDPVGVLAPGRFVGGI